MNPLFILYIILFFLIAEFILHFILDELNRKTWSPILPDELKSFIDEEKYRKSLLYDKEKRKISRLSGAITFVIIILVLSTGLLGNIDTELRKLSESKYYLPLIFFGLLWFVGEILSIPFSLYSTFVIEEKYGFNKTTGRTYVLDTIKEWLLVIIIGGGLMFLLIWIYYQVGSLFWLWAWVVITSFSIIMTLFYSNIIVPLFNKQTPLEEGILKEKIKEFAAKVNFKLKDIYVINGSKRSSKANAYFTGLGPKKRIVLYDTLIEQMTEDEILAVLAHEIGHYKKKHVTWSFFISVFASGIMMYVLSFFLENPLVCEALGADIPSLYMSLIGFGLLFTPISTLLSLLTNVFSRNNEYQADFFAKKHGLGEPLINALIKLSVHHLSNLKPHPLYVWFYYSHPTLIQRIEKLKN